MIEQSAKSLTITASSFWSSSLYVEGLRAPRTPQITDRTHRSAADSLPRPPEAHIETYQRQLERSLHTNTPLGQARSRVVSLACYGTVGSDTLAQRQSHTTPSGYRRRKDPWSNRLQLPRCGQAKAKRQVRRTRRDLPKEVGEVIAIDFLDLALDPDGLSSVMAVHLT